MEYDLFISAPLATFICGPISDAVAPLICLNSWGNISDVSAKACHYAHLNIGMLIGLLVALRSEPSCALASTQRRGEV